MALQNTEQLKFHQDQKLAIVCISDYWSMKCFHAELLDLAQTETKLCTKVKSSLSDCLIRELYNLSLVRLKLWRTCLHVQNRFVCFHIKVIYLKKKKKTACKSYIRSKKEWLLWQLLIVSVSSMAFIGLGAVASEGVVGNLERWLKISDPDMLYEMESFQFQHWNWKVILLSCKCH